MFFKLFIFIIFLNLNFIKTNEIFIELISNSSKGDFSEGNLLKKSLNFDLPKINCFSDFYLNFVKINNCDKFVYFKEEFYCDFKQLKELKKSEKTSKNQEKTSKNQEKTSKNNIHYQIYSFDIFTYKIINKTLQKTNKFKTNKTLTNSTVVLYLKINLKSKLNEFIKQIPFNNYYLIIRYFTTEKSIINLSGYGVEISIKNIEYNAIDDRIVEKLEKTTAEKTSENIEFLDSNKPRIEIIPLENTKYLGLKFTNYILLSKDPIFTLKHISENMPSYAHLLVNTKYNKTLKTLVLSNQETINNNLILVNGLSISKDYNIFMYFINYYSY